MLFRLAFLLVCLALLVLGAEDYYKVCGALQAFLHTSAWNCIHITHTVDHES